MTYSKARFQYLIAWPLLILVLVVQLGPSLTNLVVKTIFFQSVDATITGNSVLCRVIGITPEAQTEVNKNPIWAQGAWANCTQADLYVASKASRYHQMELITSVPRQVVTVEYTAPPNATQRIAQLHLASIGTMAMGETKVDSIGTKVTIDAHRYDPAKVKWP